MATQRLTKTYIDQLKSHPNHRYDVYDEDITGLFIRVGKTGSKTFYLYYRNADNQGRNLKLGRYGIITVSQAKDIAKQHLFDVYRGMDPASERIRFRSAPTIADLADLFIAEHVESRLKPRSRQEYKRLIENKIKPKLGKMKIEEIRRKDVSRWHTAMKMTPREANFALSVLSKMMSFAIVSQELTSENPCVNLDRFKEKKCERFLSGEELVRLGQAIELVSSRPNINPFAVKAILVLCLTGCRKTEVLSLKWAYIDFERSRFHLPDSKSGKKDVLVGTSVLQLLNNLPKIAGSEWVFPALTNNGHLKAIDWTWQCIRKAAGLEGVRLHDLRHTFASIGASSGFGLAIIGKALGQSQLATTQRYSHLYNSPVEQAVATISNTIDGALSGTSADVLVLKNAK